MVRPIPSFSDGNVPMCSTYLGMTGQQVGACPRFDKDAGKCSLQGTMQGKTCTIHMRLIIQAMADTIRMLEEIEVGKKPFAVDLIDRIKENRELIGVDPKPFGELKII